MLNLDILLEVTEWSADYPVKNGTYAVDRDTGHLVAFRNARGDIKVFDRPMKQFSKSRRKFKKVVDTVFLDAIIAA